MKILKKIGIGCLALVICFCSCFKFVNAFQNDFGLSYAGPIFQSNIGSINLGIGTIGLSAYNENISLQTDFYLPDSLSNDFLISSTKDIGVENTFTYDDLLDTYFVDQEVYFINSGILTYNLHFTDIYVYQNVDNELPILVIDNGYINNEQSYDLTYKCTYFDTTTLSLQNYTNDNPIQFSTNDNRYFTISLEDIFQDITRNNSINTDYSHGGLGYIRDITINIQMLDGLSSNYPTTLSLNHLRIDEDYKIYSYEEFFNAFYDYETPGVFGWLLKSINSFMNAELFPNFSIGVLLGTIVAIPLLIYILRLFMGG